MQLQPSQGNGDPVAAALAKMGVESGCKCQDELCTLQGLDLSR